MRGLRRLSLNVVDGADGAINLKARVLRRNGSADDWSVDDEFTIPLPQAAGDPLDVFITALRNGTRFYSWDIVRLVRLGLWPAVTARVIELGEISEQARLDFALAMPSPTLFAAEHGGDESAWLDAMRILLPSYRGPPLRLFRGQPRADPPGVYWTPIPEIAALFAGAGGVILMADVPPEAVLLANHGAFEYIVDARNVDYEIERDCEKGRG